MEVLRYIIVLTSLFTFNLSFGQDVYKTPSGNKYHLASCRMVENVSAKISIEEAGALGLTACKICKPSIGSNYIASNKAAGKLTTVQCKAYTKQKTRCKHMTSIANGFCYQHNPG